jgi:hypothetical protein
MPDRIRLTTMTAALALALAAGIAHAQDKPAEGAADDRGRVRPRQADLLRALRRLPRRAAQGRHRQAADPDITQARGTDYLKVFINYGSPAACRTGAPPAS